ACQRGRHGGWEGAPGQQDGGLRQGVQGAGPHPALGQDDGVRRRRQVHGGLLTSSRRSVLGRICNGEGQRAFAVLVSGSSENTKLVLSSGLWQARHSAWLT